MRAILLPAARHGKSSRGTPRLRRLPGTLHGALRLAARTTTAISWPRFLACTHDARRVLTSSSTHPSGEMPARSALLHPVAASCGVLVRLDWPALTPALSEIRLLTPRVDWRPRASAWRRAGIRGLAASWLFDSRRQAHFLLEHHTVAILMPNVRAKRAPAAGRQARAGEKEPRTARPGLVACRWRSA